MAKNKLKQIKLQNPITGRSESVQRAKAGTVEQMLADMGYTKTINPFKIGDWLRASLKREPTYDEYMNADIAVLRGCTSIYTCKGWSNSPGCMKERNVAINGGLEVIYEYSY